MKKEIVITKDGSNSIYLPEMDEHYHSINGSVAESEHIFIQMGLAELAKTKSKIRILEVGMGTGLNVMTSILFAQKENLTINYCGIEAYPLDWQLIQGLNYSEIIKESKLESYLEKLHKAPWNKEIELATDFYLEKKDQKIQEIEFIDDFDLIYFDAFAPEKQEEMWTREIFTSLFNGMKMGGILVTYCVKGVIRRRLQAIGFEVEKLPGPIGGKREMLRARKT